MAAELLAGRAFVDLVPRVSPAGAAAAEAETGALFSGIAGKAKLAGLAIGAGLIGGAVVVGAGLFKLGDDFHSAFSTIRVETGATGPALDGLKTSFKNVFSVRPDSMDDVAEAIGKLKSKGDLTGPSLEAMAVSELRLAKITKEDLGAQLDATTELFNNWGTAAADQPGKLDELFRASQATGTSVTDLASAMASGGSVLRTTGLNFEQSAALVGLLGKSGVSTTSVMAPLSRAIATAAKEGKNAGDVLRDTFDAIRNAPDDTSAAGAAIDVFGARAGPRLAGLIREGKLSFDELSKSIAAGGDTIQAAATDTSTIGGKFAVFKNKIRVALEPLATTVFDKLNEAAAVILPKLGDAVAVGAEQLKAFVDTLSTGMTENDEATPMEKIALAIRDVVIPALEQGVAWFRDEVLPIVQQVGAFIGDNLTPILIGLGAAVGAIVLTAIVSGLVALAGAIASPIVLIGALVAGLIYAYNNFDAFRSVVDAVVSFLVDTAWPAIQTFAIFIADQIGNLAGWWSEHWAAISEAVGHAVAVIQEIITIAVAVISWIWANFGDSILTGVRFVWDTIRGTIEFVLNMIRGQIEFVLAIINGDWGAAWDAIAGIIADTWDFIFGIVSGALDLIRTLIGDQLETTKSLVSGGLDAIVGFFVGLPGRIAAAAGDVFGFLWDSFKSAINAVISGWNNLGIPSFHIHITMPSEIPNIDFDTPSIDFPDIPYLAKGARILKRGLAVVGDKGPEVVNLGPGASVVPLTGSDRAALFGAAGSRAGFHVEHLEVPTMVNATADEVVDAMDAKLGWKFSGRNDR